MSTVLRVGLTALVLAMTETAGAQLVNGSFEDPDKPENPTSDVALGWGRWGAWINRETGWKPTRNGACVIGYHHWQVPDSEPSGIYQDVAGMPPRTECTFKVFACTERHANAESIRLSLEPLGGGPPLASESWAPDNLEPGRWHELSVSGKNPAKGIRVVVEIKPADGPPRDGSIKLDNASLAQGPAGAAQPKSKQP